MKFDFKAIVDSSYECPAKFGKDLKWDEIKKRVTDALIKEGFKVDVELTDLHCWWKQEEWNEYYGREPDFTFTSEPL